jgi:Rod binding domain-containing protein
MASSGPLATPNPPEPKDAGEAAGQFEALLLTQLLRSIRSEEDREDSTLDTMWDMAAQQFAQVMADAGGLGLAKMIRQDLAREAPASPDP